MMIDTILATIHIARNWPSGRPALIFSLVLVAACMLLTLNSWPSHWRRNGEAVCLVVLLFALLVNPATSRVFGMRAFPSADGNWAWVICMALGVVMAFRVLGDVRLWVSLPALVAAVGLAFIGANVFWKWFSAAWYYWYWWSPRQSSPVPIAPLLMAGIIAPYCWRFRRTLDRRDRLRWGTCRGCGYDLRASVEAAACPECGEPIPASLLDELRRCERS